LNGAPDLILQEETERTEKIVFSVWIVEVKAIEKVHPISKAQLLSYMNLLVTPLQKL
jgi:hypothetical protein